MEELRDLIVKFVTIIYLCAIATSLILIFNI